MFFDADMTEPFLMPTARLLNRRQFVTGIATGVGLLALPRTSWGQTQAALAAPGVLAGNQFDLAIGYQGVNFTGRERLATVVNGSLPAPILRWQEGQRVTLRVTNNLAEETSIHWHGIILPSNMDGVPGLSFHGIKPGETFRYQFDVRQSGTYWYHSHSGFQEQTGLYGAIIIDPKAPDPVACDREHVLLLSDWSDEAPQTVYAKLKKMSHYYNVRPRTLGDLWRDVRAKGAADTWSERAMWNQMRMSDTDIADVTGYTYTYLLNGSSPDGNWTGLFKKGEKIRLRIINGSAMTIFDFRIPGLKMTVVAADGQNIAPVTVDEFRIGVAETYDVIVEPDSDSAYCLFAQSIDRSGFARGTLASDPALVAAIPAMDTAPVLGHGDMGMGHAGMSGMDHSAHSAKDQAVKDQRAVDHSAMDHSAMDHSQHQGMVMKAQHQAALGKAGMGSIAAIVHPATEFGPQVDMRADMPVSGLHDPGIGLRHHAHLLGRKVLNYGDLHNLTPTLDRREPGRELQLHLTGNMARYMWSFDGVGFMDADPIRLTLGERLRITLVNDTMMTHPIHLHGLWSELETGDPKYIPRKHTVLVQPGSTISYLVTADSPGRWAYHCHLLYHMLGMMREVRVEGGAG